MISRLVVLFSFSLISITSAGQRIQDSLNENYIRNALTYLASDELGGRVNYTKGQLLASEFISNEFESFHMKPFTGYSNYFIPFEMENGFEKKKGKLIWNGSEVEDSLLLVFPSHLVTGASRLDDYTILEASKPIADSLLINNWKIPNHNLLIWIKISDSVSFSNTISNLLIPLGVPASTIMVAGVKEPPVDILFSGNKKSAGKVLNNIIGVLPGKNLPKEIIIFSAHYDHVDRTPQGVPGGIFNGANDNASGTVAVLALANYFSQRHDNERTIMFCLFAGEELGLLGSKDFAKKVNPENIKAVINIEMIGVHNAVGKNAFMVTGPSYSTLDEILKRNLTKENFKVRKLNYDPRNLYRRSDNFSFAQYGIPAHSIMCSDDSEPCYHMPCDETSGIDFPNMTRVIKAIANGSSTLIKGTETPVVKNK